MQIPKPSSSSSGSVAIQLANDMEGRDEPYEAEAHDQYDRRCNLEAWRIVCVEPEHVATATATPEPSMSLASCIATDPEELEEGFGICISLRLCRFCCICFMDLTSSFWRYNFSVCKFLLAFAVFRICNLRNWLPFRIFDLQFCNS